MNNSTQVPQISAAHAPLGVTSNFDNFNHRGNVLVIVSTICLFFMVVLHVQRMLVKFRTNHRWGLDDCCCTLGKLGAIGNASLCLSMIHSGIGLHQWDVPLGALSPLFLEKLYAIQLIIPPTFLMIKLSLLMLYWHVFHPNKAMRYLIWAGIFVNTMVYSAFLGAQILVWTPSSGSPWFSTSISAGVPIAVVLAVAQSSFNVISDLYLFVLPFGGLLNLSLSTRQKIGVGAIFMTGAGACASSILTLVYRLKLLNDADTTWDLGPVYTLSIVETTVGIMCSCMPALASFFRLHTPLFQSLMSILTNGLRRSTGNSGSNTESVKGSSTTLSTEGKAEEKRPASRVNWPFRNVRSGQASPALIGTDEEKRDRGVEETRVGG